MIGLSYSVAALSMIGAAVYLVRKFRGLLTSASLLVICLLLFYGPAHLIYLLYYNQESVIYRTMMGSPYFGESIVSLDISIAIMFGGCILGIELSDRTAAHLADKLKALAKWPNQPLARNKRVVRLIVGINLVLVLFMTWVSVHEDQLGTIAGFLHAEGSQAAKDAYRLGFGGSDIYFYRVVLESIAPFFLVWGILEVRVRGTVLLLLVSVWLFLAILVGRANTLSRAPVALLFVQLAFSLVLCFTNRLGWRLVAIGALAMPTLFYPLIHLTIPEAARDGTEINFFFRRTFAGSNETLLEFFAAFPHYLSYTWGANFRPLAWLTGQEFQPAYADVSYLWHGGRGSTSNAMFIADAWAAFSFFGVAVASILIGAVCRAIDFLLISREKSAMTIAVLSAVLIGVLRLMVGSASTAMVSGGLVIVPLIALFVSRLAVSITDEDVSTSEFPPPKKARVL